MIEMKVMGIAIDTASGSPIIVLNDIENRKALPIWIGSAEASAIIRKIENIKVLRPMTHDLIIDIIEKTGYTVDRIEINDVENETYFSTIFLINDDDAVNMARKLSKELGLGVGISSGANLIGCILAKKKHEMPMVTVFADDNKKYLSTDLSKPICDDENFISNKIKLKRYEIV